MLYHLNRVTSHKTVLPIRYLLTDLRPKDTKGYQYQYLRHYFSKIVQVLPFTKKIYLNF